MMSDKRGVLISNYPEICQPQQNRSRLTREEENEHHKLTQQPAATKEQESEAWTLLEAWNEEECYKDQDDPAGLQKTSGP